MKLDISEAKYQQLVAFLAPARLMPVLSIPSVDTGLHMAEALLKGGMKVLEVTLRTEAALKAMEAISARFPEIVLGAGTIRHVYQFRQVQDSGARFGVSPGAGQALLAGASSSALPFMPGVSTVSEAMSAADHGFRFLKLFPAEAVGGIKLLKSVYAPLPDLQFCPTGGITADTAGNYLALPNVIAIGGSWMVPDKLVIEKNWPEISMLAQRAMIAVQQA